MHTELDFFRDRQNREMDCKWFGLSLVCVFLPQCILTFERKTHILYESRWFVSTMVTTEVQLTLVMYRYYIIE